MKKHNFKKDLFMVGLLAGIAATTAVTGYYFKKELAATRQRMQMRECGDANYYYLYYRQDQTKAKQQLDAIPEQIAAIEQGLTQ